jgi:major membrane immunogen (membrane-anchored lipoprotein)
MQGMQKLLTAAVMSLSLLLAACGSSIDVVDAGTYAGTVDKAVPDEQEIYVTLDNGKRLELYFTEQTQLMRDDKPAQFAELSEGTPVSVTVSREGNANKPQKVEIRTR